MEAVSAESEEDLDAAGQEGTEPEVQAALESDSSVSSSEEVVEAEGEPAVELAEVEEPRSESEGDETELEPAAALAEVESDEPKSEEPEEADSGDSEKTVARTAEDRFVERRGAPRSPLSLNRFFDLKVSKTSGEAGEYKSFLVDLGPRWHSYQFGIPFR